MTDVLVLTLKVILMVVFAMFLGYKTGLFSMNRIPAIIAFAVLFILFSAELYAFVFRGDASLVLIFRSSFFDFTLDMSLLIRVLLLTWLMGLLCSVFGIAPAARISTVKDLCALAMLIAISVALAVYCTVRVGSGIKIPFKFISVFVTAAIFGPIWGGAVGALSDIIAFVLNPVGGSLIPQITMVEFLYGFTYGLFFYNMQSWNGFKSLFKIVVCVIFQIVVLNLGLTTYFLMPLMNMEFKPLLIMRSVSGVINMAIQLVVLAFMSKYISSFRKVLRK